MPIVDVAFHSRMAEDQLRALAATLPNAVSRAVECPEEPYEGDLQPGDVEVRFHQRSLYDSADLDLLVEVRSKWFASRAGHRARASDDRPFALTNPALIDQEPALRAGRGACPRFAAGRAALDFAATTSNALAAMLSELVRPGS